MRMAASWSGSTRSTGYKVAAAMAAPESELPSGRAACNRDRVALKPEERRCPTLDVNGPIQAPGCKAGGGRGSRSPVRRSLWRRANPLGRAAARRGRPARGSRRSGRGRPAWLRRWSPAQGRACRPAARRRWMAGRSTPGPGGGIAAGQGSGTGPSAQGRPLRLPRCRSSREGLPTPLPQPSALAQKGGGVGWPRYGGGAAALMGDGQEARSPYLVAAPVGRSGSARTARHRRGRAEARPCRTAVSSAGRPATGCTGTWLAPPCAKPSPCAARAPG